MLTRRATAEAVSAPTMPPFIYETLVKGAVRWKRAAPTKLRPFTMIVEPNFSFLRIEKIKTLHGFKSSLSLADDVA